jgi:plastocyanin
VRVKPLLAVVLMCAAATTAGLATNTVTISQRGRKFNPDTLRIVPGTMVRIENDDRVTHHVYIEQPDMKFDSGEQAVGNEVTLTFDHDGTFAVRCAIHPMMHLDVTVAPAN